MAADKNYEEILEKVCDKINGMDSVKETDVLNIKNSVESIENLITDTQAKLNFQDIKNKLEKIADQVDSCNDSLLKDLYNDLNTLKESTGSVSQHLENLQNVQNLALTSAEFEEYQKQQLDLALKTNENIFNELKALKENAKTGVNEDNIKNIETQLSNLHKSLTGYIEQVASKVELIPGVEEIGSVVSDLNSVQQKSIKQTNEILKNVENKLNQFKTEFDGKDFNTQITKISEIYDSLGMITAWIEKVGYINQSIENVYSRLGENIDFDDVSEKVDIIYENITALNNWTMKIDKVDSSILDVQSKLSNLGNYIDETRNITSTIGLIKDRVDATFSSGVDFEDISNKMDIVYENLAAINEWASRIDTISGHVEDVSGKINQLDEEAIFSKVDLIYENISLLNQWVSKIDELTQRSEELDNKYTKTNDNFNVRMDEITETLTRALKIAEDVPDMKDKLENLYGELHSITSTTRTEADSYIYTLLDIESDFLKLHKFLDDKTTTTSNDINALKERFSELNDDISSISLRTNKLILSADDANKEFKTCLETFKNTLKELDDQKQEFNLNDKVAEITRLLRDSNNTSKNLNNAFMYLAEWIDATGSLLNSMQNDLASYKEENNNLSLKIIQNDISDLLEKIGKFEESFGKYKKDDLPVLKEAISYIINKIDDIGEDAKNTYADDFTALNNSLDAVKGQINSLVNEVTLLNGAINKFNVGMNSSNNEFSSIGYEINDINKTIVNTAEEMKNLKQDMGTLVSQVNDLESLHDNVSEIKSSLTGVMVQLNTALTPDIDSLNARIDMLTEKNNSHLTELESLMQEKINQQEKHISHLEERMEDLTNKFDKLIAVMSEENKNYEVKDILNYLVTQVAAANESISGFDNNINKIVSYIEED